MVHATPCAVGCHAERIEASLQRRLLQRGLPEGRSETPQIASFAGSIWQLEMPTESVKNSHSLAEEVWERKKSHPSCTGPQRNLACTSSAVSWCRKRLVPATRSFNPWRATVSCPALWHWSELLFVCLSETRASPRIRTMDWSSTRTHTVRNFQTPTTDLQLLGHRL